MIGEVFQSRLNAPVVFAGDEDEAVGAADLAREFFQRRRRLAFRIFLVHAVEHRQPDCLGVDQLDIVSPRAKALDDELRKADAHAVGAIRTVKHQKLAHAAEYHGTAQLRRNTLRYCRR